MKATLTHPVTKRLLACLFGGFVLAVMIGSQEGSQTDFGISFRQAVAPARLLGFLGVGLVIFALMSFWPTVVRYFTRPGALPLGIGFLTVLAAMTLMDWYDPLNDPKFSGVSAAASNSPNLSPLATAFFGWLGWTLLLGSLVLGGAAIASRIRWLGYALGAVGIAGAVIAYTSHVAVVDLAGGIDHSLGVYAAVIGYLVFAGAGVTIARSQVEIAEPRAFVDRVMNWRPGLPVVVVGLILGLVAFISAAWFAPLQLNATFADTNSDFAGLGLAPVASAFLAWLGWVVFALAVVLGLAACYLRHRALAWAATAVGVAGIVLSFLTLHAITTLGAQQAPNDGKTWQNLGAGGWVACIAFSLIATGGFLAASANGVGRVRNRRPATSAEPVTSMMEGFNKSSTFKTVLLVAVALALFYPPTLPVTWQNVIVTQIGVYILLTVGLNVVVGWAGLLDLGYIAFYGIGSYTTAYLVGALPIKPPSWLHMTPLAAIPFAIIACLIAGLLLGAPTLRLRGDYLAIVTLGFGEIIQILAINNPGNLTGGPQGPDVPHPVVHLGPLHLTWGLDNLPYWYLLLIMIIVMVVLFFRLEGSRLGRAWAAIREDEVAAQATGINTTRAKLLAFAIGASTSGLAGVFFATQVGYFDPSQFTLQNSILIVAYVVFGGMGSLPGAIAGAAVLTWLPQFLKDQVPLDDRQMWIGALVLAMMIFRPAGLIPARRRAAELAGLDSPASSEVSAVPAAGSMASVP